MRTASHILVQVLIMPLIAALQFLTRLPIPVQTPYTEDVFRRSTVYFPAAGLLIGGIVAGGGAILELASVFPAYVHAVLLLGVWVFLSGGLHLDGLMDTADGLMSHRSRERMLEIMKDSRVGAMGVIACVFYVLLKASLLTALLSGHDQGNGWEHLGVLAVIPVWSRAVMVLAIAGWPYAREGSGLGQLYQTVRSRHVVWSMLLAGLMTAVVLRMPGGLGWAEAALGCAVLGAVSCFAGWLFASAAARKLGGLTGDVYGAVNEIIELVLLASAVAWLSM